MKVIVTAVGPDNRGLADPIVHYVTGHGANIAEIQMYDHDEERVFAMMMRIELEPSELPSLRAAMEEIGAQKQLSIRVWSPQERERCPRLAVCVTSRPETPLALLRAIRDGVMRAEAAVVIGNRASCRSLAEQFQVPWFDVGDEKGVPDNDRFVELLDQHGVDYIVLARYMRILPPSVCWKFAGGRILNLHHGLLPSFPGARPYQDAYAARMLTYGATCHFIVPELDAGNQIVYQSTFTVPPGMPLEEIVRRGQEDNEPHCLVEGVRRVVAREVELHFHRVVRVRE
ncbi:MAG: formyltetrahydrofolate deformylase [Candidatus Wallbacteria bacterium]|nr:formyltetrahydrofolate deformylase [Candidatus Wallbacteria bacterium]